MRDMNLEEALSGDLLSWRGLESESVESIARRLEPVGRIHPPVERKRTYQHFMVTTFERPIAPRLIEAWVVWNTARVALIEYDDPLIVHLEHTLHLYGPPEVVLSDQRFTAGAIVREHVYARRGVAFSLADPFPGAMAVDRRLIHLQLFPATTVEAYLTDIGVGEGPRPDTHPRTGNPNAASRAVGLATGGNR